MKELSGDIWEVDGIVDAICVTTNGIVDKMGLAVMGGGIAAQAAVRFPDMPRLLGQHLQTAGNHVGAFFVPTPPPRNYYKTIVAFPTKWDYKDPSPLDLVLRSAHELSALADGKRWEHVLLPRPGCGLGGLHWEDVQFQLADILDDRFTVVEYETD